MYEELPPHFSNNSTPGDTYGTGAGNGAGAGADTGDEGYNTIQQYLRFSQYNLLCVPEGAGPKGKPAHSIEGAAKAAQGCTLNKTATSTVQQDRDVGNAESDVVGTCIIRFVYR